MWTVFKVPSFASKCLFYRREHSANMGPLELNFEGLGMLRWNKLTDRVQRVDEKMDSFV